ncbi:membrane-associated guanylate kinase, WW and PDZ domain-containing protein 1-like isoform X3 [Canis lupus baileyi]|uniref:membrane-associated guanylate kinase, WW and PDZ domain-containing protein 1-like isoform X3 n=1 Tax=Canis lupus baileyi TaxID=143281 RepID=UPI003B977718
MVVFLKFNNRSLRVFLLFLNCPYSGTTRPHKEGEVPGVDYIFITVEDFMELEKSGALLESGTYEDNYYGTPKPPAEPAPLLLNVTDQILPGATPSAEGKRKRNKSVSNMEKASIEPAEEEEEERPVVNGNGVVVTPGRLQLTAPSSSGLSQVPAHQPLRHKPGGSGSSHLARTFPTLVWAFRTTKQCEAMVFTGPLRYSPEDWQLENRSKGTTHYGLLASGRGARGCDFSFQTLVLLGKRGEDTPIHPSLRALPLVEVQSPTRDSRFRMTDIAP